MKIAITADVHLRKGHPERYNALEDIFKQTMAENIEHLIIAGDLFDHDLQNYSEFEALSKNYSGIQLHIIPGNHDLNISQKNIVGSNISIYTKPKDLLFGSESDSTIFLFVPYKEGTKMGDQIAEMEQNIEGNKWVLISHSDYYGGLKEQNPLEPGTYMPLSRKDWERFRPSTVLLGHIHKPYLPDESRNIYYVGSPCGLSINETGRRRFLVYETTDGSLTEKCVATDILYFNESFMIQPAENEIEKLEDEITNRIMSWQIDPADYSKVQIRVKATGCTTDKSSVLKTLEEKFEQFKYYKDEGPNIEELFVNTNLQLLTISQRTMELIDQLEWSGQDEPTAEDIKRAALSVIYST